MLLCYIRTNCFHYIFRAGIQENEGSVPIVPSDEVKRKLGNRNIAEVIANCSLGPILHEPYSSFDSDGK